MVKKRKRAVDGKTSAKKKGAKAAEAEAVAGEVSSGGEESLSDGEKGKNKGEEEDDEEFFETPDEKRVRLAKEYLGRLGEAKAPEEVQEQLTLDVREQQRKAKIQVFDLALGEPRFLRGHKQVPTCVCLSSDDRTAYTGGKDCALLRWDVETGKRDVFHRGGKNQFECGGHFSMVMGICLVEQRSLLLSTGYDRLVRLWDVRLPPSSACVEKMLGHQACVTAVAADPDGSQAYSSSLDKSLRVWDLVARKQRDTLFGHVTGVTCMDLYNNARPVTGGADKTVRMWKLDKDTHLMFNKHTYPVDAVTVIDHENFVSGCQDGSLLLWSHASKKPQAAASVGRGKWATALGSVRRGGVVFSGASDGSLRTWQVGKAGEGERGVKLSEAAPSLKLPGCVTAMAVGRKVLACTVGKEHKLGRWFYDRAQKDGIVFVPLSYREG